MAQTLQMIHRKFWSENQLQKAISESKKKLKKIKK
jgi:hypothetical protein